MRTGDVSGVSPRTPSHSRVFVTENGLLGASRGEISDGSVEFVADL